MPINYNSLARDYAQHRKPDEAAIQALIRIGGISTVSRILEIGCGTGNYIRALQHRVGCACFGIDPSPQMIKHAKAGTAAVTYAVGSADKIPLPNANFDLCFSVDVIHHVKDRSAYFGEAHRVLKPGGILATLTDSEETIRRRVPLSSCFPETIEAELKRYPRMQDLAHDAEQAGFRLMGTEIVETPFELTDPAPYRTKSFSCLRLISEQAFTAGLARLTRDLQQGPLPCISRNLILWHRKLSP